MGADLSRVRFDARRDYAGVVLQQGRLLLDADWNELVAILERQIRASVADLDSNGPVTGIAGVAVVPRTTPDGFRVTLTGGALNIGRGRMYVDGLLAENHGVEPFVFEPLLDELRGSADTPYGTQPYWPTPATLPTTGTYLAYLDVWQREVTPIEAPDLVEQAIGVDTTARTQTVWQVRLHDVGTSGTTCSTPDTSIPGWAEVIAPSGARLTVDTIPVTDTEDPCALPPTGGYRGLENQTYRVEVHKGGQPGTATFKWSRENGSVVAAVEEVLPGATSIRPASLGKDAVLRFKDGDWVEITDDQRDADQVAGELRKVEVHEEDGTLRFTPALPADLRLAVPPAADRHLRVRRWDQSGGDLDQPTATGAITVPAASGTAIVLESGITVAFTSTGADFRPGDHWIFPARTADTWVDKMVAAPPLGFHHHYARLGVLSFPDGETDCRTPWPPTCDCPDGTGDGGGCSDCTACVTPESHVSGALTIQQAVWNVEAAGGGTVCLAAGVYSLEAVVEIDGTSSVRVRGEGLRTIISTRSGGFRVTNSAFIRLEDFTIVGSGPEPAVELATTIAASVERLTILMTGNADAGGTGVLLGGTSMLTTLRDNAIIASIGVAGGGEEKKPLLTAELDISDNVLVCAAIGLRLTGQVAHLFGNSVAANTIVRAERAGIQLLGTIAPGQAFSVEQNTLVVGGSGIEVATSGFTVDGNDISGTEVSVERRGAGVVVRTSSFGSVRGSTRVASNRISDLGGRGIAVLAPVAGLEVVHNLVERTLAGIVMDQRARAGIAVVSDNVVTDVGSRESDKSDGVTGIQVVGCERASVESNVVHGVGSAREAGQGSIGIHVVGCLESRVADNSVDRVGFLEGGGQDAGIVVHGRIVRTQVSGNQSRRQPVQVDDDQPSAFRGLVVGANADPKEPGAFAAQEYVLATGPASWVVGPEAAYVAQPALATVTVDTNIVSGGAELPTVIVGVAGEVVAAGNQFQHRRESGAPAFRLVATAATVSANRLRGGRPSGSFAVDPKACAVLGNVTTDRIEVQGNPLDPQWAPLNPDGI